MQKLNLAALAPVILALLLSCHSSSDSMRSGQETKGRNVELKPDAGAETISPNHCRISATVVSIDSTYRSSDDRDPCSKAPCRARLRVDQVLGYGQAFAHPLSQGDTLNVTFEFTVAPTIDILPTMSKSYPGVHVGSRILTDVLASQSLSADQSSYLSFTVLDYSVR